MNDRRAHGVQSDAPPTRGAPTKPTPIPRALLRNSHRLLAVLTVSIVGVVLAACGDDGPTEGGDVRGGGNAIPVLGTDRLMFDPDQFTVIAGQENTLELSAASVEHDFVIEQAADSGTAAADHQAEDADDLHVAHADPGETATAAFTIDRAGMYTVYCSVPGHREAGMTASLEVREAQG